MTHFDTSPLRGLPAPGAFGGQLARWSLLLLALLLGVAPARAQSYFLPTPGDISTCSGNLYGATTSGQGIVPPGSNNVRKISPAAANSQVSLNFAYFDMRTGAGDVLRVFNGPSTSAPLLLEVTGVAAQTTAVPLLVVASNPTGELTVQLIFGPATTNSNYQGFRAAIACAPSLFISTPGDVAACSAAGSFTDSGGSQANYQNGENYTRVLAPDVATNRVRLAFSAFSTEANYDFLRIYDGASTSAPLLGTYSGTTGPGTVIASNPTGKLTVQFTSDPTVSGTGFVAAVGCVVSPTIGSFSPTGGAPGTTVVIQGTGLGGATGVRFNGVAATSFTVNSATQVTATVPPNCTTGPIAIATPNGTAVSTTAFAVPAPTLTAFTPTSGPAGTVVTLTGSYFTGATAVRFGNVNAPTFTVNSDTRITVTVPGGAPAAPISVVTQLGTVASSTSFNLGNQAYLISGAGGISACAGTLYDAGGPNSPYGPNQSYTRTLSPATAGNKVQLRFSAFDTYSYTNEPYDPEEIDYVRIYDGASAGAPLLAEFYGNTYSGYRNSLPGAAVTATNAAGQLTVVFTSGVADMVQNVPHAGFAADILCVATPVIGGFSPASGGAGTAVVITGTGLTDATDVKFNGVSGAFAVNSPTQVTATVPAGTSTGLISLTTPLGTGSSASSFVVLQPPTISGFTPATGAGGAVVTINGNNFTNASAVTFNGVSAPGFTVVSANQIMVPVPALATSGRLKVVTPIGAASSGTDFVVAAPTISSFSPGNGTAGTVVTLNGAGFSTATAVTFNGVGATFTLVNAGQLTATVPATAATGAIRIATPNGTASTATSFVVAAPAISGFTPPSGPAGTVVTVNGSGLLATTAVTFNGVNAAAFTVVSATQLTATVPNAGTTGPIGVSAPNGVGSSGTSFVVSAPTITSFSPGTGPVGTPVTLTGTGLLATTAVTFNGVAAAFTVVSATQVTTAVPTGATTGAIALSTAAGTATTAAFVVPPPTTVTGFSPTGGPAGTVVVVSGSGFGAGTTVAFNGASAGSVTVNSTSQLTVTVPLAATTGPISVASPSNGPGSSSTSFVVPAPTITAFSPPGGPAGTVVTVTGTDLLAATAVRFGGTAAASFTVNSATQLTATVPAKALTGAITVTAPAGTATSATAFDSGNFLISTTGGITACAGQLYDSGGPNGNYQPNEDYTRTISPGDASKKVQLTVDAGTFNLYSDGLGNDDVLEIYDGASTSAPLLARYRQRYYALPTGSVTASNAAGQLTVRFRSTTASTGGFEATIACVVPVTITGFSPAGGPAGTVVTVTGSNFSGATAVAFQGTAASFTVQSATQLTATVPTYAATGPISVTGANQATAFSATSFDTGKYLVSTAGALTACAGTVYDSGGPDGDYNPGEYYTRTIYPGTAGSRVRLTFTDFEMDAYYGTDGLTIYNGPDATAPKLGFLTGFSVPAAVTATNASGALTLVFSAGAIARSSFRGFAADITCVPGPAITSFTPTSGPAGTTISLSGANLTGATAIAFTGTANNVVTTGFVVASATSITGIVVPAGAATGPLVVTTGLGPSAPSTQLYYLPPTLAGVSPAAELPGTTVVLTGTGFAAGTNVTVLSATSLSVTVPPGAAAGSAPVAVTAGAAVSGSVAFTVLGVYTGGTVGACAAAVPATASVGDGTWRYLLSGGQVVAAYNYTGANLGTLALEVLRADATAALRKDAGNRPYLDRNFHLTASGGRFDGRTVGLRLYGLASELARLQATGVAAAALKATQYSGANEDCQLANNARAGERRVLAAPASTPTGAAWFVAELSVADHFSEFYLTGSTTPLPVELSAFTATADGSRAARLAWATASELNSAAFEVERSADGHTFARIGTVPAAGTSSSARAYGYEDARLPTAPAPDLLYYRLRLVDADGTSSYSPVRTVAWAGNAPTGAGLALYPNPTAGAATLTGAQPGTQVTVHDALGRLVTSAPADAAGRAALALPAGLPTGVYVVRAGPRAIRLTVE